MHDEKYGSAEASQILTDANYDTLNEGLKLGFKFGKAAGVDPAAIEMQKNLYKFFGAKSIVQLLLTNSMMYDKEGNVKPWNEFKNEVLTINRLYNINYLQAEYQPAVQAGHHARNWSKFVEQAHIFPNLKYRTVGDDRVRPKHKALDGAIAPINSTFWDKYYPPNAWRCRCGVVQTAEKANEELPDQVSDVPKDFRMNVGKSQRVFKDSGEDQHPYFEELKQLPEAPTNRVYTAKNKASINQNILADKVDLEKNYNDAKTIVDRLKMDVTIRPHISAEGWKNPEYSIDNTVADRFQGNIKNGFKEKRNQVKKFIDKHNDTFDKKIPKAYSIVFNMDGQQLNYIVARKINSELKQGQSLQFVIVVKEQKAVKIDRDMKFDVILEKLSSIN